MYSFNDFRTYAQFKFLQLVGEVVAIYQVNGWSTVARGFLDCVARERDQS
jgi:hypothetical protein